MSAFALGTRAMRAAMFSLGLSAALASSACSSSSASASCTETAGAPDCSPPQFSEYTCSGSARPDVSSDVECDPEGSRNGGTLYCCGYPPPAAPTCSTDATNTSCAPAGGGATAYVCPSGADPPPDELCVPGDPAADGSTPYCCITGCSPRVSLGCSGTGFYALSCEGSATPDQFDTAIVCATDGSTADGSTPYCCSAKAACTSSMQGVFDCQGESTFYACPGLNQPPQVAGTLCAPWGMGQYCCTPGYCTNAVLPSDATPCDQAQPYVCTVGSPDSTLYCTTVSTALATAGQTYYCCAAASCEEKNPMYYDCPGTTNPYSCTGAATPTQTNSSLTCGAPMSGSSASEAVYCCQ